MAILTTESLVSSIDFFAENGCWEWTGWRSGRGYGQVRKQDGKLTGAHRAVYEHFVEPIPPGLVIDHLCRNLSCVNPDHLEPVTSRENTLRGVSPNVVTYRTGICKRGHSMDDAIINNRATGARKCRTCHNLARRKNP